MYFPDHASINEEDVVYIIHITYLANARNRMGT